MRIKILTILLLASSIASAQNDSLITYTGVVIVEGATQEQLFIRARQWVAQSFRSANDVLQINDKDAGELSGKGIVVISYKYNGKKDYPANCRLTLNIWAKENKYKYSFSNFLVETGTGISKYPFSVLSVSEECPDKWPMVSQKKMNEVWASIKEGVFKEVNDLIEDLKKAMSKRAESDF